jgi:RNase adaptor protein for sRNA GlmZ degradation
MTLRNFLTFCENYYGEKYDGVLLDVMRGYLEGCSPEFLDSAANVLTRRFSRTHRKAPGPAEIEANFDEINEMIRKLVCLPKTREAISDEEQQAVAKMLHDLVESFRSRKNPGPLVEIFSKTLENVGGNL